MGEELSRSKKQAITEYYLQDDIVDEMVRIAKHREIGPTYPYGYGKRPDAVHMPGDFRNFVDRGAIAFHGSVERWRNPLMINQVDDNADLRTGWDLVIDIDCDRSMALAKVAALQVVDLFEEYGIQNVSIKFSGNRGFHLGVRQEAFPDRVEGRDLADWYPAMPQAVVNFIRHQLRKPLIEKFLEIDSGMKEAMQTDEGMNPYAVCDIENDWGDRHLFRLPYSINDKSWLVSLPLKQTDVKTFSKSDAKMDTVSVDEQFLLDAEDGAATELVIEALDWAAAQRPDEPERKQSGNYDFSMPSDAIPEENFPPTIKNILSGLEDGRKRAVFILITFLVHTGYDWEAVKNMLWAWNERNAEPLPDRYIESQLNWHQSQDEPLMPPNFDNGLYQSIGVYEEDPLTKKVKNPVSYAFAKSKDTADETGEEKDSTVACPYCGKEYKQEGRWYKKHVKECFG